MLIQNLSNKPSPKEVVASQRGLKPHLGRPPPKQSHGCAPTTLKIRHDLVTGGVIAVAEVGVAVGSSAHSSGGINRVLR